MVTGTRHWPEGGVLPSAMDPSVFAPSEGWELQARCRDEDPLLFFGPNRFEQKRERLAREAAAKEVCATCPAIQACREHALAMGEHYGVWGGLGESDRRTLLYQRERRLTATAV
jgi:WhiB family transcriptional regulator, redox-sensing transcriptional regulator